VKHLLEGVFLFALEVVRFFWMSTKCNHLLYIQIYLWPTTAQNSVHYAQYRVSM
jgi:hypothetical protein